MTDPTTYLCPQCQIGHLKPHRTTYVRVVDGMVVSIPDTLAYACDVCGYREFDQASIAHVDVLVDNEHRPVSGGRMVSKSQPIDGKSTHRLKR